MMTEDPHPDPFVALLPHRPPFRFVDAVDLCRPGDRIEARWHITGDEAFLSGHFPGNPVVPGVIQLEALAQTGAIGALSDPRFPDKLPLFGGVEECRFRRQVVPGDTLVLVVEIEKLSARGGWSRGTATVDGDVTASARMFMVFAPAPPKT